MNKISFGVLVATAILTTTGCQGEIIPGNAPQAPVQPAPQAPVTPAPVPVPPVSQITPTVPVSPPANPQQNQNVNVDFLKRVFYAMNYDQKTQVVNGWSSVKGSPQSEEIFLVNFVQEINNNGVVTNATGKPLTNGEAREFLDWTLTQSTT